MHDDNNGIPDNSTSSICLNTSIRPVTLLREGKSTHHLIMQSALFITSLLLHPLSPMNAFLPRVIVCKAGKSTPSFATLRNHPQT